MTPRSDGRFVTASVLPAVCRVAMKKLSCFAILLLALIAQSRADTALVFNEIMYHPETNEPAFEWVEMYNQLAVDLDISGWHLDGNVNYTFAPNTRVPGRGYIVVAIDPNALALATGLTNIYGPFTGRLNNSDGDLRLYNNIGRLMDHVNYGTEEDWPGAPGGAGASLAKIESDLG